VQQEKALIHMFFKASKYLSINPLQKLISHLSQPYSQPIHSPFTAQSTAFQQGRGSSVEKGRNRPDCFRAGILEYVVSRRREDQRLRLREAPLKAL
jgi:hypothetical protein